MTANPTSDGRRWVCDIARINATEAHCTENAPHQFTSCGYVDPAPVTPDAERASCGHHRDGPVPGCWICEAINCPPSVGTGSATRPDTARLRSLAIHKPKGDWDRVQILAAADWIDAQPDLSELAEKIVAYDAVPLLGESPNLAVDEWHEIVDAAMHGIVVAARRLLTEGGNK